MIRVALVDDQAIVRAGLARILSPADGFEVVAECADGRQAVAELPGLHPDVVLMDIRMPDLDGIAATKRLRAAERPLVVLVLTTFGEDEVLWGAIEAGAAGFVLKSSSAEDLIAAVRAVAGGGAWFDPAGRAAAARAVPAGRCPGGTGRGAARTAHQPRARRPAVDGARCHQCRNRRGPAHR
jgi:DNA-binding NarL/FixJ family response regulator